MNIQDARYVFEHRLLPQLFYGYKQAFIGTVLNLPNKIYDTWTTFCENEDVNNPFSADDFRTNPMVAQSGMYVVEITMPPSEKKEKAPCTNIFLLHDKDFKNLKYITIEEDPLTSGIPFICGWTEHGNHISYGMYDGTRRLFYIMEDIFTGKFKPNTTTIFT